MATKNQITNLCSAIPRRWILAMMCFLGLFNAFAMRSCLSFAITEMVTGQNNTGDEFSEACPSNEIEEELITQNLGNSSKKNENLYSWDEHTQGLILSSFYWGYVLIHLPGGIIAEKYGGKHTLGIGILVTAIFTILTPIAIQFSDFYALILVRFFMGLGEGTTYPAINVLLSQWTPPEEKSRTGSFIYAGALLGIVFATLGSAFILHISSWPYVFYFMGGISVIWFVIWSFTCYSSPREHPYISIKERNFLAERMAEHTSNLPAASTPWRHILLSKPLWAVIIGLIGYNWSILMLITDLPKYLREVLRVSLTMNGYFTSMIYICMWLGGILSSCLADYVIAKNFASITAVRKIGSVISLLISPMFIIAASYAGCDQVLVVGMFALSLTLLGFVYPSVMINALDLSPNYAGVLMALTNGISAFAGILSPYIVGELTTNQNISEWRKVFWILFAVSAISNLIYLSFGSGEVQYWNDPSFKEKRKVKGIIPMQTVR